MSEKPWRVISSFTEGSGSTNTASIYIVKIVDGKIIHELPFLFHVYRSDIRSDTIPPEVQREWFRILDEQARILCRKLNNEEYRRIIKGLE